MYYLQGWREQQRCGRGAQKGRRRWQRERWRKAERRRPPAKAAAGCFLLLLPLLPLLLLGLLVAADRSPATQARHRRVRHTSLTGKACMILCTASAANVVTLWNPKPTRGMTNCLAVQHWSCKSCLVAAEAAAGGSRLPCAEVLATEKVSSAWRRSTTRSASNSCSLP